ncbi:stretch-activated cation channel Mid1 [Vararia minispora EC-137]|uniref:Stretch-activated cation channel Mid1 n=1 Tax=Vararia minispora EC-137 TaxID=1314806 RepID=A0ACB8QGX4_9AGAM|nr:stretch-activated cation channel Mid1 [Vararia minispora EC-137]
MTVPDDEGATRTQLSLNVPLALSTNASSTSPRLFGLPAAQNLSVSVALCASTTSSLQFFVSNDSSVTTPGPGGGSDVYQIELRNDGFGNWTGVVAQGAGTLAVYNLGSSDSLQIGASDSGPLFDHIADAADALPLFGDTTSNQALLFSPVFAAASIADPSYPNYTLPSPQEPFSSASPPPADAQPYTLLISPTTPPTGSQSLANVPQTACALRRAAVDRVNGTLASAQSWLRGPEGWRTEWFVEGLVPNTNYTAYAIRGGIVGGPSYFVTKSGSFSCPILHSLPYCPSIAHAVPLPFPSSASSYTSATLSSNISTLLLEAVANFTTALTTFACGRDLYSPLQSCADCRRAYQRWLCSVSFPRCAEFPPSSTSSSSSSSSSTLSTSATATNGSQTPTPALTVIPASATPTRGIATLPVFSSQYTQLLPCYETCTAADRACPSFLGFKCPVPRFNADASYGVGYVDGGLGLEDIPGAGIPGVTQDQWGNVWCDSS